MVDAEGQSSNHSPDLDELFRTLADWEANLKDVPPEFLDSDPEPSGP